MIIEYQPIGTVHSPVRDPKGAPIQPSRAKDIIATVEVFPDYTEGLDDLEGFSHIFLLCHLHRSRPHRLKVVPYLDDVERGLFATRAPSRPNPIGLSLVDLLSVDDGRLTVRGLDMIDGTPVLDIKPFVGEFDQRGNVRTGWLDTSRKRTRRADDRFSK